MSAAIIRAAHANELKTIQNLNHELFISDNKHLGDLEVNWPYEEVGEAYFKRMIDEGESDSICLVAELEGTVAGYLAGALQRKHAAYKGVRAEIENMCVTEVVRGKSIGTDLIDAFYDWCRGKSVDFVMVNAFSPNESALHFYKSQGFEDYSTTLWHKL